MSRNCNHLVAGNGASTWLYLFPSRLECVISDPIQVCDESLTSIYPHESFCSSMIPVRDFASESRPIHDKAGTGNTCGVCK